MRLRLVPVTVASWVLATGLPGSAADKAPAVPPGYQLLYEQKFDTAEALKGFAFTDPNAWKHHHTNETSALELAQQSQYKPAVRSPVNIALIANQAFGDFILEADFIQTGREYGHRDMCVFFGFQDPQRFYYVHMATKADPNAHNVTGESAEPRPSPSRPRGTDWASLCSIQHEPGHRAPPR